MHDEVVDLRAESVWGVSFHMGWGLMWRKGIVTKEHVLKFNKVEVAGEIWPVVLDNPATDLAMISKTGIPPLTTVRKNELVYSPRVVCNWTAYFVRDTYRSKVLEVGADGIFKTKLPYTSQGDSGLPILTRTGSGNEVVGCIQWFENRTGGKQV